MLEEKVILSDTINLPHRQRWGFMFFVAVRTQCKGKRVSVMSAIAEFKDAFDTELCDETLKTEYYRLLKLHKECLRNGI